MQLKNPWPMITLVAVVLALWIFGCHELKEIRIAKRKARGCVPAQMPQLHHTGMLSAGVVRKDLAATTRVTLEWSNTTACWTGVEATQDFTNWQVVTKFYARAGEVTVTLSNRPPQEFYRAFNSL
jgi:hypothetical protein